MAGDVDMEYPAKPPDPTHKFPRVQRKKCMMERRNGMILMMRLERKSLRSLVGGERLPILGSNPRPGS